MLGYSRKKSLILPLLLVNQWEPLHHQTGLKADSQWVLVCKDDLPLNHLHQLSWDTADLFMVWKLLHFVSVRLLQPCMYSHYVVKSHSNAHHPSVLTCNLKIFSQSSKISWGENAIKRILTQPKPHLTPRELSKTNKEFRPNLEVTSSQPKSGRWC